MRLYERCVAVHFYIMFYHLYNNNLYSYNVCKVVLGSYVQMIIIKSHSNSLEYEILFLLKSFDLYFIHSHMSLLLFIDRKCNFEKERMK